MDAHIKKVEKILKTDVRYLLHGGFHMTTEYFISVVVGICFGFFVANMLNPTEYGAYKYVLSVGSTIAALTLTGLATSLVQSIARGYDGAFRQVCITQLKWSIPALVFGLSVSLYYFWKDAYLLSISIAVVTILIPLRDLGSLSGSYLSGKEFFREKARLNIVRTVIGTGTLASFAYFIREAHLMVMAQYFFEALGLIVVLWFVVKKHPPINSETGDEIALGKHLSFVDIIQRALSQFDKLFVFQFFGATALATYSIALMPVMQLISLNRIIRQLVAPRFARRTLKEIHATIFHKTGIMFLFSFCVMVVYIISAPLLYKYLLPQYAEFSLWAQITAIALLFTPQTLFGQILVAHGFKKELYFSAIVGNIAFIGSVFIGGVFFGVFGVLVGFVMSRAINFLIALIAYLVAYNRHKNMLV